ncbi:AraC family transcriptional regulator [Streptomyces spongiae]|nr:AraC family transcriptional regulator [Streptomyces spongiae]
MATRRTYGGAAPVSAIDNVDVLASLLDIHRLRTVVAGRVDLTPPWRVDAKPTGLLAILVQSAGHSHLVPRDHGGEPVVLGPGDLVVYLRDAGGYLHDGSNPATPTWQFKLPPEVTAAPAPLRLAQGEPVTSFVCCMMQWGDAPRAPLLDSLPPLIHISAQEAAMSSQIGRVADMMVAESATPGPAGTRLISRLAEALLILVLREQAHDLSGRPGLRALSDPLVAPAIKAMHADPGSPWSVASLAATCGLSRSAFAARFTDVVGQTPLSYLSDWRMATATKLLGTTDTTVDLIAEAVGYRSEAAFRRAFGAALNCTPREYRSRRRQEDRVPPG